ncbi:hypothetical protein ACVWXN_008612 [Bradyrhizobium sp. i1.4.4]
MAGLLRRAAAMAAPLGFVTFVAAPAYAAGSEINTADTAWMIVATALVLMMTIPGLALSSIPAWCARRTCSPPWRRASPR